MEAGRALKSVWGKASWALKTLLTEDGPQGGWPEEGKKMKILLEERRACSLVAEGLATLSLVLMWKVENIM